MKTWPTFFSVVALLVLLSAGNLVWAQGSIVWNGPVITFVNLPGSDWTQAANQDQITANVWLTRASTKGLFNAASEGSYTHFASPADTEWAYGLLANYATLTYASWENWNAGNPPGMVGRNAVLHLVTDDIYIAIKYDFWGGSGGGFTYERTTFASVPEPAASSLAILGALSLLATVSRKKSCG